MGLLEGKEEKMHNFSLSPITFNERYEVWQSAEFMRGLLKSVSLFLLVNAHGSRPDADLAGLSRFSFSGAPSGSRREDMFVSPNEKACQSADSVMNYLSD